MVGGYTTKSSFIYYGTSPILEQPPTCLQDLQLEIIEIVEAVRSPFDDVYLDLGVEGFARRIGEPIREVVQDAVEIGRDGLDDRI